MLETRIRERMIAATKARDALARGVLKVALGEVQSRAVREGRDLSDDEAAAVLRKLVKSNEESIAATSDADLRGRLERENEILADLLPRALDEAETEAALAPVADAVRGAPGDGAATGVAMKHLKSIGAQVDGKTVAAVVRRMRA